MGYFDSAFLFALVLRFTFATWDLECCRTKWGCVDFCNGVEAVYNYATDNAPYNGFVQCSRDSIDHTECCAQVYPTVPQECRILCNGSAYIPREKFNECVSHMSVVRQCYVGDATKPPELPDFAPLSTEEREKIKSLCDNSANCNPTPEQKDGAAVLKAAVLQMSSENNVNAVKNLKKAFWDYIGVSNVEVLDDGLFNHDEVWNADQANSLTAVYKLLQKNNGWHRNKRAIIAAVTEARKQIKLWPSINIAYKFSSNTEPQQRSTIQQILQTIADKTCLTFYESPNAQNDVILYRINNNLGSAVCGAGSVGHQENNTVTVQSWCVEKHTILHETLHVLGVSHEQSRPDRDDFITVDMTKIDGLTASNFAKALTEGYYDTSYDYMSIMHYPANAFLKSGQTGPTITTKDPSFQSKIGLATDMSEWDAVGLNNAYKCPPKPSTTTTTTPPTTPRTQWITTATKPRSGHVITCPTSITDYQEPHPSHDRENPCERCADEHGLCFFWASAGECSTNPAFMLNRCTLSCGACDCFTGSKFSPTCSYAAALGRSCKASSSSSRRKRDAIPLETGGGAPAFPVDIDVEQSQNSDIPVSSDLLFQPAPPFLLQPAAPGVQKLYCRRDSIFALMPPGYASANCYDRCLDEHNLCCYWASIGKCEQDRSVLSRCRLSCGACNWSHDMLERGDPGSLTNTFCRGCSLM